MRWSRTLLLPLCCLGSAAASAQEAEVLDPIVVTTPRLDTDPLELPAAVSVVELPLVEAGAQRLTLDEPLQRVPGVFTQNQDNLAQGLRISIRGFGARATFGVRGVRLLVDGLPLTLPDGQSQLDGLDLNLVERAEVIRGPFSAAYGNASGGVVQLLTFDGPLAPSLTVRGQTGSHGLREGGLLGGGEWGPWNGFGGVRAWHRDGYREHSEAELYSGYGKLRYDLSPDRSLTTIVNVSDRRADDPGALTRAEMNQDPRQAAPNNTAFDAGERARQQRLGWLYQERFTGGRELRGRLYVGRREFDNRLPFELQGNQRVENFAEGEELPGGGQVELERLFSGVGADYSRPVAPLGIPGRLLGGIDLEHQRDDRQRYANMDGRRGPMTMDQIEEVTALGLFGEAELALTERLSGTAGLRYDWVRMEVDDRFDGAADASGSRTLDQWSWLTGLSYALAPRHRLYANVASVFETPTTNELANPQGRGFNPDLEPQTATNFELGLKGAFGDRLHYDAAVFTIRLEDELIAFQIPGEEGRNYFENAGRSRRDGFELALDWWPADLVRLSAAYTFSDFEFRRFQTAAADFAGNQIPGIPRQVLFTEAAFEGERYFAALNARAVDRLYADNANSERVSGYAELNTRLGWRRPLAGGRELELFAGVNNLLDREYPGNVRINAFGGRYYEPAPERNGYAGANLRF